MLRLAVARVDESPAAVSDTMPEWLGASERLRWVTLPDAARGRFAASRALLRELLQTATGASARAWDVSAEQGARPLARYPGWAGTLHVSLSHRFDWVAAALSDAPVGVDVERERAARSDPCERAELMLSASELAQWQALPAAGRESALLTRWTVKEAWFKACARGVAPWDFRHVVACACAPGRANVRAWTASPLHVALCCDDAGALAAATCNGLDDAAAHTSFWRVERASPTI